MSEDRIDREVEALLTGALPAMGADWREQAVAAVQAVRPARRRRLALSPRAWRLAAATAVVAMLLPLAGSVVWKKVDAARWRHEVAQFQNPAATTPEGRGIYTVHYVARDMYRVDGRWDSPDSEGAVVRDVRLKFPDKERSEEDVVGAACPPGIYTREGDRELAGGSTGFALEEGGESYEYRLDRVRLPFISFISPDAFTETGVRQAGFVNAGWDPVHSWNFEAGENILKQREETGPNGELVIVAEHWKTRLPDFHGVYRTSIDRDTHLVTSWHYEITGLPHRRADNEGGVPSDGMRLVVDNVAYNEEMHDALFSTEPPRDATVLDCYSPEGMRRGCESAVQRMEQSYQTTDPEQWAKAADYWSHEQPSRFAHLDVLPEKEQADLRGRLRAIGIEVP